jgi:molybdenum cofactor cytidylyltransferase
MITAIILAAGESKRMGQPKMLMRWGRSTVLQTVIETYRAAGLNGVDVVTGGARAQIEALVGDSARTVFNAKYRPGGMLSSIQVGLRAQPAETQAVLVALGDQPQVQVDSVRRIREEYDRTGAALIVPSYQMHRGHPWLVAREYWHEILKMQTPESSREFLDRHQRSILYLELGTATILQDLDTPEDYSKIAPIH